MIHDTGHGLDAPRDDVARLRRELDGIRQHGGRTVRDPASNDDPNLERGGPELLERAWADLQAKWHGLQASSGTHAREARVAFERARQRLRRMLDIHRQS